MKDGISALLAEGPVVYVFSFSSVRKVFRVLNPNLFILLFLLYYLYLLIKYVQLFSFGFFSKGWKLDKVKNVD